MARAGLDGRYVRASLLLLDAALCIFIILRVNYTEIDWEAYMTQIRQISRGERDYLKIHGGTGPLVYPAGHVYLYSLLYHLTSHGTDIFLARVVFAGVYLATLACTMAAYRVAGATRLHLYVLLVLSKRAHSIFLLRLFNDAFSSFFMALCCLCYVKKWYTPGTIAFSAALGVKMNALLYLPGLVMVLIQAKGVLGAVRHGFGLMIPLTVLLGLPFLLHAPDSYLARAFDFGRAFEYRWTVNWRFVPRETFESPSFAGLLLLAHVTTLVWFAGTRWNRPSRRSLWSLASTTIRTCLGGLLFPTEDGVAGEGGSRPMAEMTPSFILTTLYTSNLIGIAFARSAHYQFYAWFVFSVPFLLDRTGLPVGLQAVLWVAQEWGWNVYPSTAWSSRVVVAVPVATLVAGWIGTAKEVVGVVVTEESHASERTRRARLAGQAARARTQ